jgi:hypothetical protein
LVSQGHHFATELGGLSHGLRNLSTLFGYLLALFGYLFALFGYLFALFGYLPALLFDAITLSFDALCHKVDALVSVGLAAPNELQIGSHLSFESLQIFVHVSPHHKDSSATFEPP